MALEYSVPCTKYRSGKYLPHAPLYLMAAVVLRDFFFNIPNRVFFFVLDRAEIGSRLFSIKVL